MKNVCVPLFIVRKLAKELNSLPASILQFNRNLKIKRHLPVSGSLIVILPTCGVTERLHEICASTYRSPSKTLVNWCDNQHTICKTLTWQLCYIYIYSKVVREGAGWACNLSFSPQVGRITIKLPLTGKCSLSRDWRSHEISKHIGTPTI